MSLNLPLDILVDVKLPGAHLFPSDPTPAIQEAVALQRRLAAQVERFGPPISSLRRVAGVDLSPPAADGAVQAAVVVLALPSLEVVEVQTARRVPGMPYVPGLLAFREVPAIAAALERLESAPDALLVDGQGVAHPRRFGIACHLGLLTGLPTVGCAKSILTGRHGPLGPEAGEWTELREHDEVLGAAVRTRRGTRPVYVSLGHRMDLVTAVTLVLRSSKGFRLPEPTRLAHQAAAGKTVSRGTKLPQEA